MRVLLILILCIFFVSCKKDRLKDDKEIFVGNWHWMYSDGDIDICGDFPEYNTVLNPGNQGHNYEIEFLKKGKVNFYQDSELMSSHRVVVKVFGEPYYACGANYSGFEIALDNYKGTDIQYLIGGCINLDTLIIKNGFPFYDDGCSYYTNYFVKE